MSLLARIAGPRVLLGVVLAAVAAIALMWWRLDSAQEGAARAEQASAQLRDSLRAAESQAQARRVELERMQAVLVERDRAIRGARERAEQIRQAIAGLQGDDRAWAMSRVPVAILERLRGGPGHTDTSDTPDAARGVDAAVPHAGDAR